MPRRAVVKPASTDLSIVERAIIPAPEPVPIGRRTRPRTGPESIRRSTPASDPRGVLWYGDNLTVLREQVKDESVDLVYLDPPFNSNRAYNLLFRTLDGLPPDSQIQAFEDTWRWNVATVAARDNLYRTAPIPVQRLIGSLVEALGENDVTAYLIMMTLRLVELYRVMKPTASLYLHCDPTASHYLKIVLDALFGPKCFRSEIIWQRTNAHSDGKQGRMNYGHVHDSLLFYTKSDVYTWNPAFTAYSPEYVNTAYRHIEPETGRRYRLDNLTAAKPGGDTSYEWNGAKPYKGRFWAYSRAKMEQFERDGRLIYTKNGMPNYKRYLDEMAGVPLQDLWTDISPTAGRERIGFPTQKPLSLLERIISVSSLPDDLVLDPFCGCGTAVAAAQELGRRWIGIDVTSLAIGVIENRLDNSFKDPEFVVRGQPTDITGARDLAMRDRFQFQWWIASQVGALPQDGRNKKGPDGGIDGIIPFVDDPSGKPKRCLVSVKSGKNIGVGDVRDLLGTIESVRAEAGVLVTLEEPTIPMKATAAKAGWYRSPLGHEFPRVQIVTVADILAGQAPGIRGNISILRRQRRLDIIGARQQRFDLD